MPEEFQTGQSVGAGRYILQRELGRGGMGVVWLAKDNELGEDVALKFVPSEIRNDAMALDDMRRETLKSRRLTHPHIARIHDFCNVEGETPFITMEYMSGQNLSALQVEQPDRVFPWEQIQPWLQQLCSALQYAHEENVVHRDLKPGNLMLDAKGRIKLCDFGLAASVADSVSRISRDMGSSGTPPYMSPQQLEGAAPSASDDIYSLGATIYELLTSKPPFHSGDIPHQIRSLAPTTIQDKLAELGISNPVPDAARQLVMQCLVKNPIHRPANASDVAASAAAIATAAAESDAAAISEPSEESTLTAGHNDIIVPEATELSDPEPSEPPLELQRRARNRKIAGVLVGGLVLLAGWILTKDHDSGPGQETSVARAAVPRDKIYSLVEGANLKNCTVYYLRDPDEGELTIEAEAWSPDDGAWTINEDQVIAGAIAGEDGATHKSYLVFETEELTDFELAFAYEFHSEDEDGGVMNAGVFYRSHPSQGSHFEGLSPVLRNNPPRVWPFGATSPASLPADDTDFWENVDPELEAAIRELELYGSGNWCVIKARGNRIHHFINGECVNREIINDTSLLNGGRIAIEIWSASPAQNLVEFEGFFIKTFD